MKVSIYSTDTDQVNVNKDTSVSENPGDPDSAVKNVWRDPCLLMFRVFNAF